MKRTRTRQTDQLHPGKHDGHAEHVGGLLVLNFELFDAAKVHILHLYT